MNKYKSVISEMDLIDKASFFYASGKISKKNVNRAKYRLEKSRKL
jgi:hypothetical protein